MIKEFKSTTTFNLFKRVYLSKRVAYNITIRKLMATKSNTVLPAGTTFSISTDNSLDIDTKEKNNLKLSYSTVYKIIKCSNSSLVGLYINEPKITTTTKSSTSSSTSSGSTTTAVSTTIENIKKNVEALLNKIKTSDGTKYKYISKIYNGYFFTYTISYDKDGRVILNQGDKIIVSQNQEFSLSKPIGLTAVKNFSTQNKIKGDYGSLCKLISIGKDKIPTNLPLLVFKNDYKDSKKTTAFYDMNSVSSLLKIESTKYCFVSSPVILYYTNIDNIYSGNVTFKISSVTIKDLTVPIKIAKIKNQSFYGILLKSSYSDIFKDNDYAIITSGTYAGKIINMSYLTEYKALSANKTTTTTTTKNNKTKSTSKVDKFDNTKKCPYSEPKNNIKLNSSGNGVKWVQWYLIKNGYTDIKIDGKFGINIKSAVLKFQKSKRLTRDGIVGPKTRAALKKNIK